MADPVETPERLKSRYAPARGCRAAALIALGVLVPVAWGQQSEADSIMERHAQAVAAIKSFDVRFIRVQPSSPLAPEGVIAGYEQYHMISAGGKTYRDRVFFTPLGAEREKSIDIWTGEYQYVLRPPNSPKGAPELNVMLGKVQEPFLGPEQIFKGLAAYSPLIPFTALADVLTVRPDSDELDWQEPVVLLEGSFDLTSEPGVGYRVEKGDTFGLKLWLSRAHYLPLRQELRIGEAGNDIVSDVRYERIDGNYFPIEAIRTTSHAGIAHFYKADVQSLKVNPTVPPDVFEVKLEPGTFVWDYILDVEYLYMPPETLDLTIDKLLADALDFAQASVDSPAVSAAGEAGGLTLVDDARGEAPPRSRGRGVLVMIAGALLLAWAVIAVSRSSRLNRKSKS